MSPFWLKSWSKFYPFNELSSLFFNVLLKVHWKINNNNNIILLTFLFLLSP